MGLENTENALKKIASARQRGQTANEFAVNEAGTSKKASATQIKTFINPWTTLIKLADQTNNTAVLVDDDTLQFATVANTNYTIRYRAFLITNATADSKYRLTHSGTTTRVKRQIARTSTADVALEITAGTAFDAADVVLSTTGINPYVEENIILQVGASGGIVKFTWAQVTLNAGPTSCLEGSYMEYATT